MGACPSLAPGLFTNTAGLTGLVLFTPLPPGLANNTQVSKKSKLEPYTLPVQQANLIKEDKNNAKLWDDVLSSLQGGPVSHGSPPPVGKLGCSPCPSLCNTPVWPHIARPFGVQLSLELCMSPH